MGIPSGIYFRGPVYRPAGMFFVFRLNGFIVNGVVLLKPCEAEVM